MAKIIFSCKVCGKKSVIAKGLRDENSFFRDYVCVCGNEPKKYEYEIIKIPEKNEIIIYPKKP